MIVNRSLLPRPPDKADDGKALPRVAMQQVLLIAVWVRLGQCVWQPVIMGDQTAQQALALVEEGGFVGCPVKQVRKRADEVAQALEA
ncbi:hypothetical protein D3C79_897230 [compost metagenome]